jgi:hypothetical protein
MVYLQQQHQQTFEQQSQHEELNEQMIVDEESQPINDPSYDQEMANL